MKVTDEMVFKALQAFVKHGNENPMKAALEAVFNHASQEGKKVEPVSDTNKLDDGWVEHIPGNPCPVDGDTIVEAKTRSNGILKATRASCWHWNNIIAYRIIEEKMRNDGNSQRNPHALGTSLYLQWQLDKDKEYTEKLCNRKLAEMYPEGEKKEPKKRTLLQWISDQYCGEPSPLTEREQFLMQMVSKYGQYLEQRQ